MYPQARSVGAWLRHGWFVAVAYIVGFLVMLAVWGWHPTEKRGKAAAEELPAAVALHPFTAPALAPLA